MLKDRYEFLKGYENNHVTIGFGSYGQVKLARNIDNRQIVAVKIINKLAKNQIIFHDKLAHPKIIQLLNYQIDKEKQKTFMVLQYADDGTLFEKIKSSPLTKFQIKKYFRDVCEAVSYLHGKEIMHRDIKPENILLTKKGEAKLCDFGFAAILGERKTLCGTYEYMSPEMIQNRSYDQKIDIWALGILLFEMIAGQAPFRGESSEQVLNQMKTKIFFCQKFEMSQINLIKLILRVTPHKRPTVEQILNHPFFNEDSKTNKTDDTEISLVKKYTTTSSQSFLQNPKLLKKEPNFFEKKPNKEESLKQPQNSFPFYMPKTKLYTIGRIVSTGNSAEISSARNIVPQIFSKNERSIKTEMFSPKKKENKDNVAEGEKTLKYQSLKNYSQLFGANSASPVSLNSFGGVKFSGVDFKQRPNNLNCDQIQPGNSQQQQIQKKGFFQYPTAGQSRTFYVATNKNNSNRLS